MKKILASLMAVFLLLCLVPLTAYAAGSASLTGPSVVRAGDTITLSFSAGGGIHGGEGSISYDSTQLELQGYTKKLSAPYEVEFNGNGFIFYDNSMESPISNSKTIFTATFRVKDSVATGTVITVNAQFELSDGETDVLNGTRTYSVTVAAPLSGNNNLGGLTVNNAYIGPGFSADNTYYSGSVPFAVDSLDISAYAEHPAASVNIYNNYLNPGSKNYVTIIVTAENGATKEYYIEVFREQDPNYVPSAVNSLEHLSLDGFHISPAFDPEQLQYAVYLPYEVDALTLSAKVTDEKSAAALPEVSSVPVGSTVYEIPVTAENGEVRVYTLTVVRADVFPPVETEPTVPEETEPVTEPTTEPTTVPTTQAPTEAPTEPAPTVPSQVDEEAAPIIPVFWGLAVLIAFAAGCGITLLLKRES